MNKQTAVEWLSEVTSQLFDEYLQAKFGTMVLSEKLEEVTNQAKEMEKEQINKAAWDGYYQEEMTDIRNYYELNYKQQ